MVWVIARDDLDVRMYMECRSGCQAQWSDDVNKALSFKEKNSADRHIKDFQLSGAGSLEVGMVDLSIQDYQPTYTRIGWDGLHEIWTSTTGVVLYVTRTERAEETNNYTLNVDTLAYAKKLADDMGVPLRIRLGLDIAKKTYNDIALKHIEILSVRDGPHGPYYLIFGDFLDTKAA